MAKVLLVEDDNNLREIYEARLQAEGYETATASDGEEALVVAKEAKPDLVISDVMMPKISGFEMLDILRNTDGLKEVRVIMLTALGQAEDKARADQLGADKYLVKSQVTLEDIVKTAHQLLDDAPAAPAAPVAPVTPAQTEPTTPVAAQPAPVAEAPAAPVATPAPAPLAAPTPSAATDVAASTNDEAQAMQAQIDSFAAQPATPAPAVDPAPAASAPAQPVEPPTVALPTPVASAPVQSTATNDTTSAHDDQVMAQAVNELSSSDGQKPSDVTAVEVAPPVQAAPPTGTAPASATDSSDDNSDSVTNSHKKIIRPLTDTANAKPDLNALLAAEEAALNAQAAVPPAPAASTVAPTPPPVVAEPPADPNQPNPNDIAL